MEGKRDGRMRRRKEDVKSADFVTFAADDI
jgi:hypothetical protein